MQKKLYMFMGFLFLIVLSFGIISAESCNIVERDSCDNGTILMGLSDSTNAHGQLWNVTPGYNYVLCCDFERTKSCGGTNKIIGLSDVTNAHAEIPSLDDYNIDICYGNLSCRSTNENCMSYEMEMLSLSSETNAHLGGFNDYDVKICCRDRNVTFYNYSIELEEGWNLISIPLVPENTDYNYVLDTMGGIKDTMDAICGYIYEPSEEINDWKCKAIFNGNWDNGKLQYIKPGYGYWINMKEADTLQGFGSKTYQLGQPPEVDLATNSWNLIGHYGLLALSPDYALKSLEDKYETSIEEFEPKKGYWLWVKIVQGKNSINYAPYYAL